MHHSQYRAFGITFDFINIFTVVQNIRSKVSDDYSYIVTPNVNHAVRYQNDAGLRDAYSEANLRLCDSRILFLLFKIKGLFPEIVPGSDLTVVVLEEANKSSWSVSIVGGSPEDILKLESIYPNTRFAHYNPPMGFYDSEIEVVKCIEFVKKNPAQIYLFAVGCPRQELLAKRILSVPGLKGVGLCIGASVMFVTGSLKRAPLWIQRIGFEWLFRILSEPRRLLGRYISDGLGFVPLFLGELFKR